MSCSTTFHSLFHFYVAIMPIQYRVWGKDLYFIFEFLPHNESQETNAGNISFPLPLGSLQEVKINEYGTERTTNFPLPLGSLQPLHIVRRPNRRGSFPLPIGSLREEARKGETEILSSLSTPYWDSTLETLKLPVPENIKNNPLAFHSLLGFYYIKRSEEKSRSELSTPYWDSTRVRTDLCHHYRKQTFHSLLGFYIMRNDCIFDFKKTESFPLPIGILPLPGLSIGQKPFTLSTPYWDSTGLSISRT